MKIKIKITDPRFTSPEPISDSFEVHPDYWFELGKYKQEQLIKDYLGDLIEWEIEVED